MHKLVDLHCHILPGVDDGAPDPGASSALLDQALRSGVDRIVLTPHFYPAHMDADEFLRRREAAFASLKALPQTKGMRFRLGAEIAYVPFFDRLPLERLAFEGTRYLLMELDFRYLQPGVEDAIRACIGRGLTPILAHVERYPYLEQDPMLLYSWVCSGALAQVNAGYILRSGSNCRRALKLAERGLVHVLASDAHNAKFRPVTLREGVAKLPAALSERLCRNADAVFENREIESRAYLKRPPVRVGFWKR